MEEVIVEIDINLNNKLVLLVRLKLLISTKEEWNIFSWKEVNTIYFHLSLFLKHIIYIGSKPNYYLIKDEKKLANILWISSCGITYINGKVLHSVELL